MAAEVERQPKRFEVHHSRPAVGTPGEPAFGERIGEGDEREGVGFHGPGFEDGRWSYLFGADSRPPRESPRRGSSRTRRGAREGPVPDDVQGPVLQRPVWTWGSHPSRTALGRVETLAMTAELTLSEVNEHRLGPLAQGLHEGRAGRLIRAAKACTAAGLGLRALDLLLALLGDRLRAAGARLASLPDRAAGRVRADADVDAAATLLVGACHDLAFHRALHRDVSPLDPRLPARLVDTADDRPAPARIENRRPPGATGSRTAAHDPGDQSLDAGVHGHARAPRRRRGTRGRVAVRGVRTHRALAGRRAPSAAGRRRRRGRPHRGARRPGLLVAEFRPPRPREVSSSLLVRVADLDAHHEHSREHGARILQPPTSYPYGERQCTARDVAGHRWTFSQTIADVAPEEWGGTAGPEMER